MNIFALQKKFVTTLLHDTIETYPGSWRIVHEAIQNAADAICRNDSIKRGKITIDLHVGLNKVVVTDNGNGISINNFDSIFQLGGGDKRDDALKKLLKGSQGVGIKATCFTSSYFKVSTVHAGKIWECTAKDFYKFAEPGFNDEVNPPKTKESRLPSGTKLEYSLHDYTVTDFLNEVVAEYLDETQQETLADPKEFEVAIETYFRTKTYLGCILRLLGTQKELKPIDVEINTHLDSPSIEKHKQLQIIGCDFLADVKNHGKIFDYAFPGKYLDALALHANLDKGYKADKLFTNFEEVITVPPDQTLRKALIQVLDKQQIKRLLYRIKRDNTTNATIMEEDPVVLKKHKRALDIINGLYLVIAQRGYMGKYFHMGPRQNISVNGLPTNIALGTPRGGLAYLNNIHLVIDVDCTLGFGKRNIPSRTKGIVDALYADIWAMLRRICPAIVGIREGKDPADASVWDKELEYDNYKDAKNLFRDRPLFLKNTPQEEQEVIALFFELIGRKLLKGYFPLRVGGNRATYDALFFIADSESIKMPKKILSRDLKIVEFKYKLSEIISDFNDDKKFLQDLQLVICWENDCGEDTSEYNIHSLEREGIEPYPGAQLRIQKGTQSCQVLVLKDFVNDLEFGITSS